MTKEPDFHEQIGSHLLEWRDGHARLALDIQPKHLNKVGIIHGGVLLTLLDEVGAMVGLWCSVPANRRSSVTVDLAGHFTGQASTGRIVATGEMVEHGKSLYFARSEVRDEAGRVLSYGTSTHKWRRGSAEIEGVPLRV